MSSDKKMKREKQINQYILKLAELENIIVNMFINRLRICLIDSAASFIKLLFMINVVCMLVLIIFFNEQHQLFVLEKLHSPVNWLLVGIICSILSGLIEVIRHKFPINIIDNEIVFFVKPRNVSKHIISTIIILECLSLISFIIAVNKAINILGGAC